MVAKMNKQVAGLSVREWLIWLAAAPFIVVASIWPAVVWSKEPVKQGTVTYKPINTVSSDYALTLKDWRPRGYIFSGASAADPVLSIDREGRTFVHGKETQDDSAIANALREWWLSQQR